MTRDQIKPEEYYSPSVLIAGNVFPWMNHSTTLKNFMLSDKGRDLLKPIIKRVGKTIRYHIKGENVLRVLELADSGLLET